MGTTTRIWLLALLVLQIGLPQLEASWQVRYAAWLGCMWGGLSVGTWMLGGGRQSTWGLGLLLAVAVWHIGWMHHVSVRPLSRYVLSMGGLVVVQAVAMLLAGSPVWQRPGTANRATPTTAPAQFGIASLLGLTLLCAASFAAARHYETNDQLFYPGIALSIGVLVSITLFAQRLIDRPRMTWLWAAGLLSSVVGGVYALSTLAAVNDGLRNQPSSVQYIERTDVILGTFAAVVLTTMLCGRIDAEEE